MKYELITFCKKNYKHDFSGWCDWNPGSERYCVKCGMTKRYYDDFIAPTDSTRGTER